MTVEPTEPTTPPSATRVTVASALLVSAAATVVAGATGHLALPAPAGAAVAVPPDRVKVVYLTSLDGSDDRLNDGAVKASFIRLQRQMAAQTGGIRLNAESEIASVELAYTRQQMEARPKDAVERIVKALTESGEVGPGTTAVVFYDGPPPEISDSLACGYAKDKSFTVTVLDCAPLEPEIAGGDSFVPRVVDKLTLHEILHSLGAWHSRDRQDVLYDGVGWQNSFAIDPERDDYWQGGMTDSGQPSADLRLVGPAKVEAAMAEAMFGIDPGRPVTGTQRVGKVYARTYEKGVLFGALNKPAGGGELEASASFLKPRDAARHLRFLESVPPKQTHAEFLAAAEQLVSHNQLSPYPKFGPSQGQPERYHDGYRWPHDNAVIYGTGEGEVVAVAAPVAERYEATGGPTSLGWPVSHLEHDMMNPNQGRFEEGWISRREDTGQLHPFVYGRVDDCLSGTDLREAITRPNHFIGNIC